jgi:hypothetical protein
MVLMMRMQMLVMVMLVAGPVGAQEIESLIADRPDFTEASRVVGNRVVQVEAGLTQQWGESISTFSLPELLVRIGVSQRLELRFGAPDLIRESSGNQSSTSPGDVYAGLKWQVGPIGQLELAFMPGVSVPVEREGDQLRAMLPEMHFIIGHPIGAGSIAAMSSLLGTPLKGQGVRFQQTVVGGLPISESVGMFVEYIGQFGASLAADHLAHVGFTWQLSPDLQLDIHGGRSLRGEAAPFLGAGLAFRL